MFMKHPLFIRIFQKNLELIKNGNEVLGLKFN